MGFTSLKSRTASFNVEGICLCSTNFATLSFAHLHTFHSQQHTFTFIARRQLSNKENNLAWGLLVDTSLKLSMHLHSKTQQRLISLFLSPSKNSEKVISSIVF